MPFPFSVKYSITLKENFGTESYQKVLKHIEKFIIEKPAEKIVIQNTSISFKAGSSWSNWNIMRVIDKGVFNLSEKDGQTILAYEFFMYQLFITTSIMAVFIGVVSQQIWGGIFCFFWLCGMNWVVALIRHKEMLNELGAEIDSLMKSQVSENILSDNPQTNNCLLFRAIF